MDSCSDTRGKEEEGREAGGEGREEKRHETAEGSNRTKRPMLEGIHAPHPML